MGELVDDLQEFSGLFMACKNPQESVAVADTVPGHSVH